MTTQEEIDEIIEDQYSSYRGRIYKKLKPLHNAIRKAEGDEKFLEFLRKAKLTNPRPKYIMPSFNQSN